MVVSLPVGTGAGRAAVVPGSSDAVVMQVVRRAFSTAIKLTVINPHQHRHLRSRRRRAHARQGASTSLGDN